MRGFTSLFDSYVKYNFHVGLAVWSLTQITALDFQINLDFSYQLIFFIIPFLGYNFIKFHLFFLNYDGIRPFRINFFIVFIFLCLFLLGFVLFYLSLFSQLLFFLTLLLVLLYCLPLPFLKINLRGYKGLKIHLVALSWVFITVFLPLSLEGKPIKYIYLVYGLQRYFFVIAATLPFEIRDLKLDHPNLSTWPQRWGVKNTKALGFILLIFFVFLELWFRLNSDFQITIFTIILLMIFILISKEEQSKYFSSFWVEGIPILWLILKYVTINL